MQPQVTIAIPTHNGARRLPLVLGALAQQDAADNAFEVVVVDNNSNDDTARVVCDGAAAAALRSRGVECRLMREGRQGLAYARSCGVLGAHAPLVCFLDDDNVPSFDYVRNGIDAMADSDVGLLVSCVIPQWEVTPPASIARRSWLFAASSNLGDSPVDFGSHGSFAPTVGAGLWLRRDVFLAVVPWRHPEGVLSDRRGDELISGQDIEIGFMIGRAGYRRLYLPNLKLYHIIPASRLHASYVCRLIEGITRSEMTLKARYEGYSYTAGARLWVAARVLGAAVAAPAVILCRRDGLREALFILAMRWAQLKGPYPAKMLQAQGDGPSGSNTLNTVDS
jgi:glycosyltransferase involved in cell wall biosynthesis